MRRKNLLWISLVALLLTSVVMTGTVTSSSSARMYVAPQLVAGIDPDDPDPTFTVAIKADVGVGAEPTCYGWEFILSFNPGLLQVPSHTEEDWKSDTWYGTGTQTTFRASRCPIVPDSEMVAVNETLLIKPDDYTIVYETGNITLTTAPGLGAEIIAMYQFSATVYHVYSGHFLEETGWATAWGIGHVAPDVDEDNGLVGAGDAIMADEATGELPPEGAYGTGKVLATIEFQVINYGICALELESTELSTVVGEPPHQTFTPISHTVEHGVFDSRPYNLPPVADFTVTYPGMVTPVVGLPITFDASASYDNGTLESPAGWIVSYFWDFGDDTNATGVIVDHIFATLGTYTVSLTVTDNDGLNDTAAQTLNVVIWMEGGAFPDLLGWQAKPQRPRLNEDANARGMDLCSLVGNPTEDEWDVYVEFTLISKDEARVLGKITTPIATLEPGENKRELTAYFDLNDPRWEAISGSPEWIPWYLHSFFRKYTGFAKCYHSPVGLNEFTEGLAKKDFQFKVVPAEHDIAAIEVTTNATNGVPEGSLLEINVTMENQGTLWEPFDITVTYEGITTPKTTLEVRRSELEGEEIGTETFILNTTGMTQEAILIKATLSKLTFETDLIDNTASCVITIV